MTAVETYLRVKLAAQSKEPPISLPGALGAGVGAGAVAGIGRGLLKNISNMRNVNQLQGKLPELEYERAKLKAQGLDNRKLLRKLLVDNKEQLPYESYYGLRKGYEKGLVERSRVAKTLKALKGMTRKSMLRHGLLGAGAGLGAGLLGATSLGYFD